MSPLQLINTGAFPNDATGDPLQTAFEKCNANFTQFGGTLNPFTPTTPGLVPASGGGMATALRADGAFTSTFTGTWTFPVLDSTTINATTGDIVTVNATTVAATNINATNLTAGTFSLTTLNATNVVASSQVTIGASNAPAYDSVTGNIGYYARTAAEIAAGITPASFVFAELTLERYGGAPGTISDTALAAAITVATQKGGGTIQALGVGTYTFANAYSLPNLTILRGLGNGTIFHYTGTGSFLTILPAAGRVQIQDLQLTGTSQQGFGIVLGNASGNGTFTTIRNVMMNGFGTALRIGGATWLTCIKCEFGSPLGGTGTFVVSNNTGIDFNAFASGSTNYTSAVSFYDCVVSNNSLHGVNGTNVPVFMNSICWYNCNVQNNCQGAPSNPQFYMSRAVGFIIDSMYMEFTGSGTVPDAIHIDNHADGTIRNTLIFQSGNGIVDGLGGGTVTNIDITGCSITATAAAINLPGETNVIVRATGIGGGTIAVSGPGSRYLAQGNGLASWSAYNATLSPSPTLTGTGGGPAVYSVNTGNYSQEGNDVTVCGQIITTGLGGLTGAISIPNALPVAPQNGISLPVIIPLEIIGCTPAGSNNQFYGKVVAGSTTMLIIGGGTAAPAQVNASALAAATTINWNVKYQVN